MTSEHRASLTRARRVVLKVGSKLIADSPIGRPALLADEIALLRERHVEVVVVTSGAIALGRRVLGLHQRPHDLPTLQAAAAVGQTRLMRAWEQGLAAHQLTAAQVLVSHDDLSDRGRFLSARLTLRAIMDAGVIPIINENDTVAVEEIRYGDNDLLAALVCNLVSADTLLVLTDVVGLCDAPPDQGGVRIPLVEHAERDADGNWLVTGSTSGDGSGGMASKIEAARSAARSGVRTALIPGAHPHVVTRTLAGDDLGTLFIPSPERLSSKKHWIGYGSRPTGKLVVDDGAHRAVAKDGKSLLPAGIVQVEGEFGRGHIVRLLTTQGAEFARGLVAYSAAELRQLQGLQSQDIEATLGYKSLDEVIHRDDLVIL